MMVKSPRLVLEVEESSNTQVTGTRSTRAEEIIDEILSLKQVESGVSVKIIEDIPEHMGFGSGTQLSIALGTALNRIFDLGLTYEEIVIGLGRSRRSGIGSLGFIHGGFIVDGGHSIKDPNHIPPMIHHSDIPENWQFLICVPDINTGFSGQKETNAFKDVGLPSVDLIGEVSRLVLMQMIPSVMEQDIEAFGESITKLDILFGNHWAPVQGGTYSHPRIEECVNKLLELGAYGAGQSSWGPAIYGLVEGEHQAKVLAEEMNTYLNTRPNSGTLFITSVDNQGAKIT